MPVSPLAQFETTLSLGHFVDDAAQRRAIIALQHCHEALHGDRHGSVNGVYLWGPVGRGKTWLMDLFFRTLRVPARRQHFHHFMRELHQRLFVLNGTPDPLTQIAADIRQQIRVLCFDELFVSDIGDAILLGRLFGLLFDHGVTVVATSNQAPSQLYHNGFNRDRFLPAITAIEENMQCIHLNGDVDHRLHPDRLLQRYWIKTSSDSSPLERVFQQLSCGDDALDIALIVNDRVINTIHYSATILHCRFHDLCEQALSANDFIALCDRFRAILLSDVPALSGAQQEGKIARGTEDAATHVLTGDRALPTLARHDDSVRRFIALVDECYDRGIPLYIQADVALDDLYTEGYLIAPFARTLSRLKAMQGERFGRL